MFGLEHTPESRNSFWLLLVAAVLFRSLLAARFHALGRSSTATRWDGKAQLRGLDPYLVQPDDPEVHDLLNLNDNYELRMPAMDMPTIYPPLAEQVFKYTARYLPATAAFKLPMEMCDILVMILLAIWLRPRRGRAYQLGPLHAWNPLVVIEFAGSGHSDALALAALVGAFLTINRGERVERCSGCRHVAEVVSDLLFPFWLRRNGWPRSRAR